MINGKRGGFLLAHGLVYGPIGFSFLRHPELASRQAVFRILPDWINSQVIGSMWLLAAIAAIFFAFKYTWTSDRWGFAIIMAPPLTFTTLYFLAWVDSWWAAVGGPGVPLAWLSATLYCGYAAAIYVVSGWDNPTPVEDLGVLPTMREE